MQHHDDVRARGERGAIARLLVGAVAEVAGMAMRGEPERVRYRERLVVAAVVDEQRDVDDVVRNRAVAVGERARGALLGHDVVDLLSVQHARTRPATGTPTSGRRGH
jgi:hypothetical protein